MNGASPGLWQEARAEDGRVYYWNTSTKEVSWAKPEGMQNVQEHGQAPQPWTEYTHHDGRKYWHNKETGQSVWDMPKEYKDMLEQNAPSRPSAPAFVAGGGSTYSQALSRTRDREEHSLPDRPTNDRQIVPYQSAADGYRGPAFVPQGEVEYSSREEAEAAFFKFLKRVGVKIDWTWEKVMDEAIGEPDFRAIKEPRERKPAFEKYVAELQAQERERERERQATLRSDFMSMLKRNPEVGYYSKWENVRPMLEAELVFKSAKNEDERIALFNEYRTDLYKAHVQHERTARISALDELSSVLNSLDLKPYTQWEEGHSLIQSSNRFTTDKKFETLTSMDILKAFDTHKQFLERIFNDERQRDMRTKARRARKARDGFKALLNELKSEKKLKASSKWKDIYPMIANDPRYTAMLEQHQGSTASDLFWDAIVDEKQEMRRKRWMAEETFPEIKNILDMSFTKFVELLRSNPRTKNFDEETLSATFETLREKAKKEESRHAHVKERDLIDDLRSKLKYMDPPIRTSDTYDQVRPRIEHFAEFRALDSEDLRRSAFDKVIRRLKDKEEDNAREQKSRRDHRDRDGRNGHSRHHRTRSPEPDPYEADRKKSAAARERQFRKSSLREASPRRDDRASSKHGGSFYERERKDREAERERSYISRADPRDNSSVQLDYGDSRPSSTRKRPESEAGSPGSRRDSKRLRRDKDSRERTFSPRGHKARTPEPMSGVVDGGSEDGELEEV
ncbi:hypothetical protein NA57DRAFT_79996 [Rhizodiscina lignyota]|uniref:Formin binding protein n=1 Tax=Rhizodiscina lignyota TaxID=1504668 RepID=A0A9P4M510_9PEZI|nr:hypothetical protein NA57DRAFT_79996 [Rhizodiscina lignyota]